MRLRQFIFLLLTSSVFSACEKTDGVITFRHTPSEGWLHRQSLHIDVPPVEKEKDYQLKLEVRIDKRYAYRDLWLVIDQTYETRKKKPSRAYTTVEKRLMEVQDLNRYVPRHQHYTDTVRLTMIDNSISDSYFNGLGRNLITYQIPVRDVHLIRHEQACIRLRHIMDEDTLRNVHDVGISFLPKE